MASDDLDERVQESARAMSLMAEKYRRHNVLNSPLVPLNAVLRDRTNQEAVRIVVQSMDWKDGRWVLEVETGSPYRISGKEQPSIAVGETVLMLVNPKDRTALPT